MTTNRRTSTRTWTGRVLATTGTLALTAATLAGIVAAGAVTTSRSTNPPVPTGPINEPAAALPPTEPDEVANLAGPGHSRSLVVAFVVGTDGTVASDLLAPYSIFASSTAFSAYVAADTTAPAPLEGGPAVVPTHTFADIDADPALTPDLVVVPALTHPTGDVEAPLRDWVTRQHDNGAKVLGVCSGSLVLAATGMLDGLDATSHWSRIKALEADHPAVNWLRGRRYVEDGPAASTITTTAAVTSGIPAALHLVAELAGPAEAQRVADLHPELDWTPTQTTTIPEDHFALRDWPVGLNYVMPWFRPTIGIALRDGVDELDATAAFEVYGQSAAAHTIAIAPKDTVRTRHGLTLLTTPLAQASNLDRVVVPDANTPDSTEPELNAWAHTQGMSLEPLTDPASADGTPTGGGFDAALQNLADHTDAATTTATAKMIGYPTTDLTLGNQHRAWRPVALAIVGLALAVLVGLTPALLVRRRHQRRTQRLTTPVSEQQPATA
ncbi:DJ-1/PfpI family protein [Nocardioides sp. CN2-186]|uniref:DJ-1/PfpI family protein n=1 Tax=Nocardioides tweenelious TaxID=3156607 RepID=UPI0032B4B8F5